MGREGRKAREWVVASDPIGVAATRLARLLTGIGEGARLAIAGGSAAVALGKARAAMPASLWASLRVTWVDERRVPIDDPQSNRGEAHRQGVIGPRAPVAVELPLWLDGESPAGAVRRVNEALEQAFQGGLDVLLLGLGEDGHIASLFPGHPALAADACVVTLDDSPKSPPERITLTLSLLGTARHSLLVAYGASKAGALARLRRGDPTLPASRIPGLIVVTDADPDDPAMED